MNMKMKTGLALIVAVSMHGFASAQDVRAASEGVVACQSIVDPMEKLACFEAAAAQVSEALAEPAPAPIVGPAPSQQAPAVAATTTAASVSETSGAVSDETGITSDRRLLPSWIPSVTFRRGDDGEQVEQPSSYPVSVTRIQRNKRGRHYFTTSDGQVWRQIEVKEIQAPPALPVGAVLKRAFGGSISMKFDGDLGHSFKVKRVE